MNNIQQLIRAVLAQHQHWLYRSSSKVAVETSGIVDVLGKDVASSIYEALPELTSVERQALLRGKYTTRALKEFRSSINNALSGFGGDLRDIIDKAGVELYSYESSYAERLLKSVVKDIGDAHINAKAEYYGAMEKPIIGKLYDEWLVDIEENARKRIFQTVRSGVSSGTTTDDIVKQIRGTKASQYKDGILNTSRRDVEMLVRTTRTHVSNDAYEQTYAAIGVNYVIVCATLDGRTSFYCATHDGVRYKVGTDYPSPPYHPNCRTVLMPDIDGSGFEIRPANTSKKSIGKLSEEEKQEVDYQEVDGKNYSQWFSSQDSDFQREWLGKTRYELYKNGKYSLDSFTDKQGRTYTIDELRDKDENTFKKLGL